MSWNFGRGSAEKNNKGYGGQCQIVLVKGLAMVLEAVPKSKDSKQPLIFAVLQLKLSFFIVLVNRIVKIISDYAEFLRQEQIIPLKVSTRIQGYEL